MGPVSLCKALFHTDGLRGTFINAYAAINAGLHVDDSFLILHLNGLARTGLNAGFATSTFFSVNLRRHSNPFKSVPNLSKQGKIHNPGNNYNRFCRFYRSPHSTARPHQIEQTRHNFGGGLTYGFCLAAGSRLALSLSAGGAAGGSCGGTSAPRAIAICRT